jgi:hypothetical protein
MASPCTAPLYRSGYRVQMRHCGRLGRIEPQPARFKPGWGWTYLLRLDGSPRTFWIAERALQRPELPPLSGNVVALRRRRPACEQPNTGDAA